METERIGVTVRPRGYTFGFHADILKCPKCGTRVLLLADTEDVTIKHPDIIYLDKKDEKIYNEKTYTVTFRKKVTIKADTPDEAIGRALEELEELLNSFLTTEEIFEVNVE